MKLIILIAILSSMLFSAQKQVILGSYSVESNGVREVKTVQKQIENDENLQAVMTKSSLRVISTKISGYTVVSVNALGSYKESLRVLKVFKTYYSDAFVLTYPTQNIQDVESLAVVEQKAKEEKVDVTESQILEEEKLEVERIEKERLLALETQRLEDLSVMNEEKAQVEEDA